MRCWKVFHIWATFVTLRHYHTIHRTCTSNDNLRTNRNTHHSCQPNLQLQTAIRHEKEEARRKRSRSLCSTRRAYEIQSLETARHACKHTFTQCLH